MRKEGSFRRPATIQAAPTPCLSMAPYGSSATTSTRATLEPPKSTSAPVPTACGAPWAPRTATKADRTAPDCVHWAVLASAPFVKHSGYTQAQRQGRLGDSLTVRAFKLVNDEKIALNRSATRPTEAKTRQPTAAPQLAARELKVTEASRCLTAPSKAPREPGLPWARAA